jgi:putative FmdB family regulatory protein
LVLIGESGRTKADPVPVRMCSGTLDGFTPARCMEMAMYEYECDSCGERFEIRASMSEHDTWEKPPACPRCGKNKTSQLVSNFNCRAPG